MTAKRFTTNGYYIYDYFKEEKWLVNEVEAEEIVMVMNNLDTKARERSKALSKLQKENEQLNEKNQKLNEEVCILQIDLCKTKSYKQLEKDNERLKQAYTQLKHRHSLLHDECIDAECDRDSCRKDITSLEKENEQLNQLLDYADDLIQSHLSEHHIQQWINFKTGHKEYNDFWEEKIKKHNELKEDVE